MEYLNFWAGLLPVAVGCAALVYAIYKDAGNEPEKLMEDTRNEARKSTNNIVEFMDFRPESDNLIGVINKYGKPKLTMRDTYIVGKRWYCASGAEYSLIVGSGETPRGAYKDWLNHCVTAGVPNYVMGFNEIITTEKQP